jgi:hypothetical protein
VYIVARARILVAALLTVALLGASAAAPILASAANGPKVVLIVGPVGATTDRYRQLADEAAAVARRFTPNIVRVYSPEATWPAVRRALQGAAIVVYLGHGNGWPSPYRDELYPATQNGFGLNPTAGGDDSAHQYFGESTIGSQVRLAPGAVVVLSHLCYASGNSEPGIPEGTFEQARQRVDNFAAGFIQAGAGAVIAEAHDGPAWYVEQLLSTRASVAAIWRSSPTAHGNVVRFPSQRSPGHVALMDPDTATAGFHRSIVLRGNLRTDDLQAATVNVGSLAILPHTLVDRGLEVAAPAIQDLPVAGGRTRLAIGYRTDGAGLPEGVQVGVRWDPIDVPVPSEPLVIPGVVPEPAAAEPSAEASSPAAEVPATPSAAPQSASGPTAAPAGPRLVVAESPGSVVAPAAPRISAAAMALMIRIPAAPGLYRMVTTLHDADGVAYDAETQALVPALIVRVTAPMDARVSVAADVVARPDSIVRLPMSVTNVGSERWGEVPSERQVLSRDGASRLQVILVARWLSLGSTPAVDLPAAARVSLADTIDAGGTAAVTANLQSPAAAGSYLLVLDVQLPGGRSLAAEGVGPALVRVTIR